MTSDEEHDELVSHGVGVDRAAIESFVVESDLAHLQVPLPDVGPHQTEARVVDDATIFVRQRKRLLIEPRHLKHTHTHTHTDIALAAVSITNGLPYNAELTNKKHLKNVGPNRH